MAELYIGSFLSSFHYVGLVTEGVGENYIAALVNKFHSGVLAVCVLLNVGTNNDLIVFESELLLNGVNRVLEVLVIGGIRGSVKEDKTSLYLGIVNICCRSLCAGFRCAAGSC